MSEGFYPATCAMCGATFYTDAEPVCDDVVCQVLYWRQVEQASAIAEVETVLQDALDSKELDAIGL